MEAINYKEQEEKIVAFQTELHSKSSEEVTRSYRINFQGGAGKRIPVFSFTSETNTSRGEREDAYEVFFKHFPEGIQGSF